MKTDSIKTDPRVMRLEDNTQDILQEAHTALQGVGRIDQNVASDRGLGQKGNLALIRNELKKDDVPAEHDGHGGICTASWSIRAKLLMYLSKNFSQ